MARSKTRDVTDKFKGMRKCKIIELCTSPDVDLTEDELKVFLLRVYEDKFNPAVSYRVNKCERKVTTIFMSAINKLRDYFNEKRGQ